MNLIARVNSWIWSLPWPWRLTSYGAVLALSGFIFLFLTYQLFTWRTPSHAELWQENRVPSLTIFDEEGTTLAIRGAFYGEILGLDDLPVHVAQAFLAIEDRRFYNHPGIDAWGLARATLANMRAGGVVQGGSTITQQVAKNLFLTPARTLRRKLHEVLLALWLERHLSKDEILTLYMNRIYLGAGTYGIDAAARFYFGKSARDLTLAEAAMLAGLPKAPSRYAPTTDLAQAQARAELVLENMVRARFIMREEADAAMAAPAEPVAFENTDGQQYFVDFVITEISALVGETERNLLVTTTLDRGLQALGEAQLTFRMERDGLGLDASQAALVTLAPDGAIRAMVGGREYAISQFNRAVQAERQPGSAFKPFIYVTALEAGYSPNSIMVDEPVEVGNWRPRNYNGRHIGPVPLADALSQSINSIAVQLSEEVGREEVIATAHRLGIRSELEPLPSIALGASEVTLLELTNAYLPFQSGGMGAARYAITEIRAEDGSVLYTREAPNPAPVIEAHLAAQMTDMLYQVVEGGTGAAADLGRREAAGKTGTTQDWRDAWFIGFTSDYVTGVWVGNDDASPMNHVTGGSLPAAIWRDYMAAAHEGLALSDLRRSGEIRRGDNIDTHRELRNFLYRTADQFEETGRRIGGRRRR
ncbi:PBP1A family penicillin-binding protein [bacterium AH-315-P15]|nr:PBP1A family penicillin-binding protein [bacterium AH-315-P15]